MVVEGLRSTVMNLALASSVGNQATGLGKYDLFLM